MTKELKRTDQLSIRVPVAIIAAIKRKAGRESQSDFALRCVKQLLRDIDTLGLDACTITKQYDEQDKKMWSIKMSPEEHDIIRAEAERHDHFVTQFVLWALLRGIEAE